MRTVFFSSADPFESLKNGTGMSDGTGGRVADLMVVLAAVLLIGLICFAVAVFVHRRNRQGNSAGEPGSEINLRRRRRPHRRRSPTRAETGGLPPIRPDKQDPASE